MRLASFLFLMLLSVAHPAFSQEHFEFSSGECRIEVHISSGDDSIVAYNDSLLSLVVKNIDDAVSEIDGMIYDIDHPLIVQSLLRASARGVKIRLIVDSKRGDGGDWDALPAHTRYRAASRLVALEALSLGADGFTSQDDILILSDSPIVSIGEAPAIRRLLSRAVELPMGSFRVPTHISTAFNRGQDTSNPTYSPPTLSLHNKLLMIDGRRTILGSLNHTISSASGRNFHWRNDVAREYREALVVVEDAVFAENYETYFSRIWGENLFADEQAFFEEGRYLSNAEAVIDGTTCGKSYTILFTPNLSVEERLIDYISEAEHEIFFEAFAFTSGSLIGAVIDGANLNGAEVFGIIDRSFYERFRDRIEAWNGIAPEYFFGGDQTRLGIDRIQTSRFVGKLHIKMIVIDAKDSSNAMAILGSLNFSERAFRTSFENVLVFHDSEIASWLGGQHFGFAIRNATNAPLRCYSGSFDLPDDAAPAVFTY